MTLGQMAGARPYEKNYFIKADALRPSRANKPPNRAAATAMVVKNLLNIFLFLFFLDL
jgi:hypothetical protein